MKMLRIALLLVIVVANIGCDQLSKNAVRKNISAGETIELLNNHLVLMNVENTGAFLSLGDSLATPLRILLLSVLPLLALMAGLLFVVINQRQSILFLVALSFIIGGGIGNIIDRMLYGSVTDFLFLHFSIFKTGIFNLADVSIMAGVGFIVVDAILKRIKIHSVSN
ncbi:MAG: signal peptidase II [Chitinophagales bacterium]